MTTQREQSAQPGPKQQTLRNAISEEHDVLGRIEAGIECIETALELQQPPEGLAVPGLPAPEVPSVLNMAFRMIPRSVMIANRIDVIGNAIG